MQKMSLVSECREDRSCVTPRMNERRFEGLLHIKKILLQGGISCMRTAMQHKALAEV